MLYIDISKAFDSIVHKKLIGRLRELGIDGLLLKWIEKWLTKRYQAVKINGTLSSFYPVRSGVPQGSVLGPLLFILYMSSLDPILKVCKLKYYADDCKIYMRVTTQKEALQFQDEINNIVAWADRVQLKLAFNKCFIVHLNPKKSLNYNYSMKNVELISKNVIRDLGILIDDNLLFEEHIGNVVHKAGIVANIVLHNFKTKNSNFLEIAFKTFVRPILEYGNEIIHPHLLKDIIKLEQVQRSFTRRIPSLKDYNYPERLKKLDLEPLEIRRIKSGLTFIFKILKGFVLTSNTLEQMPMRSRRHNQMQLRIELLRSKQRQSLVVSLISIWNKLSETTTSSSTVNDFKKGLENESLSKYCKYRDCL